MTGCSARLMTFLVRTSEEQTHSWASGVYLDFVALTPMFKVHVSFICLPGVSETVPDLK